MADLIRWRGGTAGRRGRRRWNQRFGRPARRGTPITPKVLAEQLCELEADGLVERVETGSVPAPVSYRLTPYG
ncbi:winged helix-turn-helix transcriptional regulator [Lentzea sp.]|uniref:winged helix-turn-helix transcriptional regulator n=1 Tax=Lentzea sp. TaxID=56099 RepID=UPI002C2200A7|nr:winged helix-turn-helix transcriptional regulator [Lentzea sp.]HUQ54799.1 winged helix-turn-helix transcriptional regulator [Lentzea sp.]